MKMSKGQYFKDDYLKIANIQICLFEILNYAPIYIYVI